MTRTLLNLAAASALAVCAAAGTAGAAAASPMPAVASHTVLAPTAAGAAQPAYWVYRNHHRVFYRHRTWRNHRWYYN